MVRLSLVRTGSLFFFLITFLLLFFINFKNWSYAISALTLFVVIYVILLFFIKKLIGRKFSIFLEEWSEDVEPTINLSKNCFIRGFVIFRGETIYTRIAADDWGLYLYKVGVYSKFLSWNTLNIEKLKDSKSNFVKIVSKSDRNKFFNISWDDSFKKWSK